MVKKITNFIEYRYLVDSIRDDIEKELGAKIDSIYRISFSVSIPSNRYDVMKEYKYSAFDIEKNLKEETNRKLRVLDKILISNNMLEFIGKPQFERLSENLMVVTISYRFMNVYRVGIILRLINILSIIGLISFFFSTWVGIGFTSVFLLNILYSKIFFNKFFI
jgi:hypothetical protein